MQHEPCFYCRGAAGAVDVASCDERIVIAPCPVCRVWGTPALRLHMPVCPSTNNLFVARRDGKGRAKTSAYKVWERLAGKWLLTQERRLIDGPVRVLIEAPFSRRRDIDNIKPVLDLLTAMNVIQDDRYIDDLRILRVPTDMSDPLQAIWVSIWPLP